MLFVGYTQVDSFGSDEEYEDDVEVTYVTLDLGSNVHKDLIPHTSEYRLAGLDTTTPMLQLGGTFFKGTHEELIGTEILFTDGRDESNLSRKCVVPVATTEKRIKFQQVEVKEKVPEGEATREMSPAAGRGGVGERGKTKGRGRAKERSRKGKGRADDEDTGIGEMILDLDTPLR